MGMPIRNWLLGLALLAGSGLAGCASDEPVETADGEETSESLEQVVVGSSRRAASPARRPGGPVVVDVSSACGTRGARPCAEGTFCDFPARSQCGAADEGGVCRPRPEACTQQYDPVCGCDGKTYGNECTAHSRGVDVSSKGRCPGEPDPSKMCGGIAGIECGPGEFCNYAEEAGGRGCVGVADTSGYCQPIPEACTREYRPVCGCDGKTYGNECTAHAAGVTVLREGACKSQGDVCGGLLGAQCGRDQFCNFEGHTNDCGAADGTGVCESKPEGCLTVWDPVCGCDGKTYSNRCSANSAGVSVVHEGECEKDPGPAPITCDHREVLCRRAEPVCPAGQVASVQGSCWGPCVKLEACTCSQENECPHREKYVCHRSAGHCGPYVR